MKHKNIFQNSLIHIFLSCINFWEHFFWAPISFECYQFHSWYNVELQKPKRDGKYNSYYEQLSQECTDWRYWSPISHVLLIQLMSNLLPLFRVAIKPGWKQHNILRQTSFSMKLKVWYCQTFFRYQIMGQFNISKAIHHCSYRK